MLNQVVEPALVSFAYEVQMSTGQLVRGTTRGQIDISHPEEVLFERAKKVLSSFHCDMFELDRGCEWFYLDITVIERYKDFNADFLDDAFLNR